jgi:hypothetical protein
MIIIGNHVQATRIYINDSTQALYYDNLYLTLPGFGTTLLKSLHLSSLLTKFGSTSQTHSRILFQSPTNDLYWERIDLSQFPRMRSIENNVERISSAEEFNSKSDLTRHSGVSHHGPLMRSNDRILYENWDIRNHGPRQLLTHLTLLHLNGITLLPRKQFTKFRNSKKLRAEIKLNSATEKYLRLFLCDWRRDFLYRIVTINSLNNFVLLITIKMLHI